MARSAEKAARCAGWRKKKENTLLCSGEQAAEKANPSRYKSTRAAEERIFSSGSVRRARSCHVGAQQLGWESALSSVAEKKILPHQEKPADKAASASRTLSGVPVENMSVYIRHTFLIPVNSCLTLRSHEALDIVFF